MVYFKNVNYAYEKELVLENIDLTLSNDDFLAIIGPNGGGKSTLLKLALGLLSPQSGEIKIFGKSPKQSKNKLAYVPQNTNINQKFPITSLEVVLMGRLSRHGFGFYAKQDYKMAIDALEKVGMRDIANENISNLSGGQRQRVYIARALCADAKLLLLDEPTASIDTNGQIQIYKLLKKLNEHIGIIVISHDINVSVGFANKVAHVNKNLFMHDVENSQTKQNIINNISLRNNHLCPVEIISEISCNDPKHCQQRK